MDPTQARAILDGAFTLAGGAVIGSLIAAIIQIAKGLPRLGDWLDAANEYLANLALSVLVIVYAVLATGRPIDLVSLFGYFLAWMGLAAIAKQAYDAAHSVNKARTG